MWESRSIGRTKGRLNSKLNAICFAAIVVNDTLNYSKFSA